jgi:hypothetical protein
VAVAVAVAVAARGVGADRLDIGGMNAEQFPTGD